MLEVDIFKPRRGKVKDGFYVLLSGEVVEVEWHFWGLGNPLDNSYVKVFTDEFGHSRMELYVDDFLRILQPVYLKGSDDLNKP